MDLDWGSEVNYVLTLLQAIQTLLARQSSLISTATSAGGLQAVLVAVETISGLSNTTTPLLSPYTIGTGKNVISAGPLTLNTGAVVTVPSGSTWTIV